MARSLNSKGREELRSFKTRVQRQLALDRIEQDEAEWLIAKINEIDAFVVTLNEKDQPGKEDIFSV